MKQNQPLLADPHSLLTVMLVYEDTPTGLRAKRSLDLLPLSASEPVFETQFWRWDLFCDSYLREKASREAGHADIILLSAHGENELPQQLREWLKRWLILKEDRPYALGLLLDTGFAPDGGESPVLRFLRCVAAAANVDFFHGSERPWYEPGHAFQSIDSLDEDKNLIN